MTNPDEPAFESLEWHDARLLRLTVDRRTPGERDDVVIQVKWPDGRTQTIHFTGCYALDTQMNFGVVAPESIRDAWRVEDSARLADLRQRWSAIGVELRDLCCFEIATNSTASTIRVYARRFELADATPDHLASTLELLTAAFPHGIPQEQRLAVMRALYDHMSDRNLAVVMQHMTGDEYQVTLNDVYRAAQLDISSESVDQVTKRLEAHGLVEWQDEP